MISNLLLEVFLVFVGDKVFCLVMGNFMSYYIS